MKSKIVSNRSVVRWYLKLYKRCNLSDSFFQTMSAQSLCKMMQICVIRTPCPNLKVVKNLQAMLCSDADFTPVINQMPFLTAKSGQTAYH